MGKNGTAAWLREGEILFPQDRTTLVLELDELIDTYGAKTHASDVIVG